MTIRPWFLAAVSLGFVAFLLLIRGNSPLPAGDQVLDDAKDAIGRTNKARRGYRAEGLGARQKESQEICRSQRNGP
jgi:hypothetical protein